MSSYGISDFIGEANKQLSEYERQLGNLQGLVQENERRRTDLRQRIQGALANLAAVVVPQINEEALRSLASTINAPRLSSLTGTWAKKEQELKSKVAAIEAMDEFQKRGALTAEKSGVIPAQIAELEPIYSKLSDELRTLKSMPRIERLIASGYDTDRYPHKGFLRFLNSEYLADWKHADEILERTGAKSFVDVAARYKELEQQTSSIGESLTDLREQFKRISALEHQYNTAKEELENLPQNMRADIGREIAAYIESGGSTASQVFPNAEDVSKRYAVIDGMKHQEDYLANLNSKITQDGTDLSTRMEKLRSEKMRYEEDPHRFRNKRFDDEQFAKRFGNDRYDRLYDRYDRMGETIYVFNDYGRVSPFSEFLWWDVMTDGRLDGNFIPDVYEYRHQHPDYHYDRHSYRDENYDSNDTVGGWNDVTDNS